MTEIKRYTCDVYYDVGMIGHSGGEYVTYEDHAAIVAALNEKLQALAADNQNMRNAIDQTIGWMESVDPDNEESVRLLIDLQTPATDAAIRDIRAQGVESYANELRINGIAAKENGHDITAGFLSKESSRAMGYAARIRKGEQE